ncbi:helix-turn-helix domain-containing protein [Veillonella sp.]|uniref:helix-turn-helix transcriptional regulator n=1 Tax=Veillonella sp. TaxID=1926307 RepID=UPI0025F04402|nr:helix-turn-helix domain-containing protein [Veillonella sp.]
MYKNLEAELAKKGWSKKDLANVTGIRYETLVLKLNGKYKLSLDECFAIKDALDSELLIEELFLTL